VIIVHHRVLDPARLADVPTHEGAETDVRIHQGRLVLAHDPYQDGAELREFLRQWRHRLLVLNVKEEGLEPHVLPMLAAAGVEDVFLLDQGTPLLVRTVKAGEGRVAVRVSEYEGTVGAWKLAGRARWIWLDLYAGFPIAESEIQGLRAAGYRICLVSPELHAPTRKEEIPAVRTAAERCGIDAVVTKIPEAWR
jgi:hypothetical protein